MSRDERQPERGAILVQTAILAMVLIGFTAFVVDYGVMWVGRRQAQNAADAGALAGAIAMAFDVDGWTDRSETGPARAAAHRMALMHGVWGEAPDVDVTTDVYFTNEPADMCPAGPGGETPCIRVDVYRNQARGNPLPMIFGLAVGLAEQGVRATATARVAVADASDCLKPWAIPDKWLDRYDVTPVIDTDTWTADDEFDTHTGQGANETPLDDPDVYTRSTPGNPGTGFTVAADLGLQVVLKQGGPSTSISPGVFQPVRLPRYDGESQGGDDYRENIATCNGLPIQIGDVLVSESGNMVGPTKQGVEDLIALDPDADWDSSANAVINSCAQASPSCGGHSPRVVAVPVFDTATYNSTRRNGLPEFVVVNIVGFFIDHMQGNNVVGYFTEAPGLSIGEEPSIDPESAFLTTIQLIR